MIDSAPVCTSVNPAVINCRSCGEPFPHTREFFYPRGYKHDPDALTNQCKTCHKDENKARAKKSPEKGRGYSRAWQERNPEHAKELDRSAKARLSADPIRSEARRATMRKYRKKNPDKIRAFKKSYMERGGRKTMRAYHRRKWKEDMAYRIGRTFRSAVSIRLHQVGAGKSCSSLDFLGCSIEFLRWWIESQFLSGMSWENHGHGDHKWHIDHVYPCSSFDLTQEDQQRLCFKWTNLRPLWQKDNFKKGSSIPDPDYDI